MSFGNHARQVRDTGLPYGLRVSRLRSCVQLYRPIGFHATLSLLRAAAGDYRRDEAALLRALEVLEASRAAWHAELRAFDEVRRLAKRQGARAPRPAERNPYLVRWWSGAPREGALHAVSYHYRERWHTMTVARDPLAANLERCVAACLASGGELTPGKHALLAHCTRVLRDRLASDAGPCGTVESVLTRDLLGVAHHIAVAAAERPCPERRCPQSTQTL